MKEKIASVVGPLALLEWGGIFIYFYASGRIHALLHPMFRPSVLVAGIVLMLCGVTLLLTRGRKASCGCGESECVDPSRSSLAGSVLFPMMLLAPLGVATMTSRDAYGANILQTRGTVETAAALPGLADKYAKVVPSVTVEPALPVADPNTAPTPATDSTGDPAADFFKPDAHGNIPINVADLLYAAEEPTLRTSFVGKKAEIIGQFMPAKRDNPTGSRFKLVRMFMVCCAADAQPVSLLVELPTGQALPKDVSEMIWTKVTGEVTFPLENGRVVALIKAKTVAACEPPDETMLY